MKKKILVLAVLLISAFIVGDLFARGQWRGGYCDGRGNGPGRGGYGTGFRNIEFMKTELGLSDKQVKQIFDLGTQYREKYFESRTNPDKVAALRIEHRKSIESVLTKDQLEKFNKVRDTGGRHGRHSGCPNW